MAPKACAYCGATGVKFTREEVFPKFLVRDHPTYSTNLTRRLPGLVLPKPQVVRDVCATCNNILLSDLDQHASALVRTYLRRRVRHDERGQLRYDHHRLARWIWKLGYNSARASRQPDETFRTLRPYILGRAAEPPVPQTLFVGVIRADPCTEEESRVLKSRFLYVQAIRFGTLALHRMRGAATFGVFLSINSYIFPMFLWNPRLDRVARRRMVVALGRRDGLTVLPVGERTLSVPESKLGSREYLSRNSWSPDPLYP